jgi:anti-anti-sigma factor
MSDDSGMPPVRASWETLPSISVTLLEDVTLLELLGEHDLELASELETVIGFHTAFGTAMVVSLAQTQFIDSSTIRVLYEADTRLLKQGRRLVLEVNNRSQLQRLLELSGVRERIVCAETRAEALELARQNRRHGA